MLRLVFLLFFIHTPLQSVFGQVSWIGSGTDEVSSPSGQKIYDQGGETSRNRITECERGLDYVKKELMILKQEVEKLKQQNKMLPSLSPAKQ